MGYFTVYHVLVYHTQQYDTLIKFWAEPAPLQIGTQRLIAKIGGTTDIPMLIC